MWRTDLFITNDYFQGKTMVWHRQAMAAPSKKQPLMFRTHPSPHPGWKAIMTQLFGYSPWRENLHTTRWCRPRVTFPLRPQRKSQTQRQFCCTRAVTAEKIPGCGTCRRWWASCSPSAVRITWMLLRNRYVSLFRRFPNGASRWNETRKRFNVCYLPFSVH